MEKEIQNIFKEYLLSYEYDISEDNTVIVHIIWGDWKHDHAYLDYVMRKNGFEPLFEKITEEDGSDCYSADHTYIKK